MKEIINNETGEVYEILDEQEINEKHNLILKEFNTLIPDEVLDAYAQLEMYQDQIDTWQKSVKEKFLELAKKNFEETGEKTIGNHYVKVTYKPAYTQKRVDTEKMKKAGIYDEFTKEIDVAENIAIKIE